MGPIKSLFKLLLGLGTGFALGYTGVSWLIGQERRLSGTEPLSGDSDAVTQDAIGTGLWDQTMARLRLALDEGRRAAAAARAEMEAEIAGRPPAATAL